ncbi:MAG: GNAT family N-acetyltransferase [Ignavibacteria bacterium]
MKNSVSLNDIRIRNDLRSGDIGAVIQLHGVLYAKEYNYGIEFETYVAAGLNEFYEKYEPHKSRLWIAEHKDKIVGFILLLDRGEAAQLRFFLIAPEYRGIGLGRKLMELYMAFFKSCGYKSSYLWTTHELIPAIDIYKKFGFIIAEEKETNKFGKKLIEQKYELILYS